MLNRLNHWIVAVLLVIGQAALLAHEADVEHHDEAKSCQVCLVAAGQDNADSVQAYHFGFTSDAPLVVPSIVHRPLSTHKFSQRSRAPPFNTLHV